MQVAILAGGKGMRLNGGTTPKALAEVKEQPIIEHVMSIYRAAGKDRESVDFYPLVGHEGDKIRLHFLLNSTAYVHCIKTGKEQQTAERLLMAKNPLSHRERLHVAYCDCLANVDIAEVTRFHRGHGKLATLVAVQPESKYGVLQFDEASLDYKCIPTTVKAFNEKPRSVDWVSAGFFIFEHKAWSYFELGKSLEKEPLEALARDGQLVAYRHSGFFKCMDTQKDLEELNAMEGAPWLKK